MCVYKPIMASLNPDSALNNGVGSVADHALEPFFGKVDPQYQRMLAEDKFAHDTYNLPKAYEGKNKYLENVIQFMITEDDDWYTRYVLPWVASDDLTLTWNIFRFNRTLMDLEPHQGVPRYVTAEREARSDRMVRRGLAFIIEHGFYKTDQGRQHYLMNLKQIVDSVNLTAYHGVIHALLSSKNHYKEWERQHGARVTRPAQLLRAQRRRWAVVQKQERGLYILDAEVKDAMKYEGVKPDTWIFPSKMSIYCTMVPSAEVEFYRKGAGASANLEKGPANMLTFRGSKVFETRPFDIDFINEPRDLLSRERQVGEYFIMKDKNIKIYSMDEDDFVEIDYATAKAAADAAGANVTNKDYIVLVRPFQTYLMASGILMKGGLDTGMTAYGHMDFQLTDNVISKTHIGHFTMYHKSIVKQPKNVAIVEDIFSQRYVRGEGTEIYASPQEFKDDLAEDRFKKDILAFWVGEEKKRAAVENPIDLTGYYDAETLDASNTDLDVEKTYDSCDAVAQNYGFGSLRTYGNQNSNFLSPLRQLNTVCFQGMQLEKDADDKFTVITQNTGHWGPNVYPGVRAVRNGENDFMRQMDYHKMFLNLKK